MVISDKVSYTQTPLIREPNALEIACINGVSVF